MPTLSNRGRSSLREFLLGQFAGRFAAHLARTFLEEETAFGFDTAHQGIQDHDRAPQVNFIGVTRPAVAEMKDHGRFILADLSGKRHDLIGRYAGFFLGPLRRVGLHEILQFGQTLHPAVHVLAVVEAFLENDVDQGVVEGQVRARTNHPVPVRLGGRHRHARVDVGQLGAVFEGLGQVVDLLDRNGFENVAAVKDDMLGVLVIDAHLRVGVTEKRAAGGVDRALAKGVMGEVVGRADRFQKGFAHVGGELGPFPEDDAVPAVFVDDVFKFVGDIIEGLVPADFAPLAGTAFAVPNHR